MRNKRRILCAGAGGRDRTKVSVSASSITSLFISRIIQIMK
ncbi:MAG: hypothetical protein AABW58_03095 [Nanoarchaeota archaeon]